MKMKTKWIITCPKCGHKEEEKIPTDKCMYFYECKSCKSRLKSLEWDCCVFCSYSETPCIPIQLQKKV